MHPSPGAAALTRAQAALDAGDTNAALNALLEAVRAEPTSGPAYLALGRVLFALGDRVRAEAVLLRARELSPCDARVHRALGTSWRQRGRHDAARPALERAVALAPGDFEAWRELGEVQVLEGALDDAERSFERLEALRPEDSSGLVGRALCAERRGDAATALALLETHVDQGAATPPAVALFARAALRQGRAHDASRAVERVLPSVTDAPTRERLLHALGEAYDRLGRPEEAFEAHRRANESSSCSYDPRAFTRAVDRTLATFDAACFARRFEGVELPDGRDVALVVGAPRSGTSLVETILERSPHVVARGELQALPDLVQALGGEDGGSALAGAPEKLARLATAYHDVLVPPGSPPAVRHVDKLPDNLLYLGVLAAALPHARFVICRRRARDVALSCFFQDFGPGLAYTRRVEWLVRRLADVERLVAHWTRVLPERVRVVDYETLVTAPEEVTRDLLDHLGLPFDEACLHPEASQRVVATASYAQVKEPLHARAVDRAASYASLLDPFFEPPCAWRGGVG